MLTGCVPSPAIAEAQLADDRGMMRRVMLMHRLPVAVLAGCALVGIVPSGSVRTQGLLAPLPVAVQAPPDNTATPAKVELGRLLFWDPVLSGHQDIACATCHHPRFAYADGRALALGPNDRTAGRNTPTLVNVGFNGIGLLGSYLPTDAPMFWDSRARGLEAQVRHPLTTREEMRGDAYPEAGALGAIVSRLSAIEEYRDRFTDVFGGAAPVTADNLARAIAAFERSLIAVNAPFDRYLRGDMIAMSAAAVRGMRQFEHLGCSNCHKGPMLSDYSTHVLGVPDHHALEGADAGVAGMYAFRTPSLRNVALTAPYMHNGVFATLNEVLSFYDALASSGGRRSLNPHVTDDQLDPLLGRVIAGSGGDMIAFLEALTDPKLDRTEPDRVPSGLTPGGRSPFPQIGHLGGQSANGSAVRALSPRTANLWKRAPSPTSTRTRTSRSR